ncbi:MAG: Chromosomal replication initiator protein DnaA [Chlamydiae bacterium]|nr:Chromosomal replication initiator protein DnaA [Chlamydiota bacterium]
MKAWEDFLSDLETRIGKQVVNQWLRSLTVIDYDAGNLYLEAKDSFQIAWFEEHIRKLASQKLLRSNGRPVKIWFEKSTQKRKKKAKELSSPPPQLEIAADPIDVTCSFTNFITCEESELTLQFFRELKPGAYNPIYLYGPHGTGKTHLLMATAKALSKQNLSVYYVHAETFTEHVVKAIRSSEMRKFREIYRHQDVLIIDDIHVFARRAATQEEFFHTFNTLHMSGRQLIFSSHLTPSKMQEVEPRLTSRFEWGILMQLCQLPKDRMQLVLENRARLHHFPFPDALRDYILENFSTSSKSMMRALDALMIRHRAPSPLTPEGAELLLADLLNAEEKALLTPEKISSTTAAYFGIPHQDILGKSQSKECSFPRKLAMYICRQKLRLPYLKIGHHFRRDHSTVMANIRQIEQKKTTEEIESALEEIDGLLQ